MKSNPERINGLLSVLRRAYRDKKAPHVEEPWRADTMRRIRQLPSLNTAAGSLFTFERIAWRMAPVAAALIIVISMALINSDMYPDQGVFDLMTYQSTDVGLPY
jgi:hypothetical protein